MNILKFILWLSLSLSVLLGVTAFFLPISVILSDYLTGSPFPVGLTVTASIIAMFCLVLFVRNLRKIEVGTIISSSVTQQKVKPQKFKKQNYLDNDVELVAVSNLDLPNIKSKRKVVRTSKPAIMKEEDFFDKHEIIEID